MRHSTQTDRETTGDAPPGTGRARFLFSFVGPGRLFSDVVLRTIETEFDDVRACCIENVDTWALVHRAGNRFAHLTSRMLVVDEREMDRFARLIDQHDPLLDGLNLVIAVRSNESARELMRRHGRQILMKDLSILPMNVNLSTWIHLIGLIDCGARYIPTSLLHERFMTQDKGESADAAPARPAEPAPPPDVIAAPARTAPAGTPAEPRLTPREKEVLKLVADGQPNKIIARDLAVSSHTVKLHIHRIMAKLGVSNRTEAAVWFHHSNHD